MDFRFSEEQQAFRKEVRAFFNRELPPTYAGPALVTDDEDWDVYRSMKRKLAEKGWIGLAYPKEYGGKAAGPVTQAIFLEEYAYRRAAGLDRHGVKMIAPTIIEHGNEEQKAIVLPGIIKGETEWCQGYSEPNAGSDLASLQTRAVRDGDDYVIDGTKIWTSKGEIADWIFFVARTDPDAPKHRGISFFICPMDTPGITHRPIVNMMGVGHFSQTWFEGARVPARYRVGEENRGWYVAMALLDFERSGVEWSAFGRRMLDDVAGYCRETKRYGRPLAEDPVVRSAIANAAIELSVGRLLAYEIAWRHEQGHVPSKDASVGKLFNTEMLQRTSQTCQRILGLHGLIDKGDPRAPLHGQVPRLYMGAIPTTIFSGSSEVQRNVIATRGIGLPPS